MYFYLILSNYKSGAANEIAVLLISKICANFIPIPSFSLSSELNPNACVDDLALMVLALAGTTVCLAVFLDASVLSKGLF